MSYISISQKEKKTKKGEIKPEFYVNTARGRHENQIVFESVFSCI